MLVWVRHSTVQFTTYTYLVHSQGTKSLWKQFFLVCAAFIVCILILLIKYGRLTVWLTFSKMNVLLHLTFIWACMYFPKFTPVYEMHCRAQVYTYIILFNVALVEKTQHLPNNRKYISWFVNLDSSCAFWRKTDFQNLSSIP